MEIGAKGIALLLNNSRHADYLAAVFFTNLQVEVSATTTGAADAAFGVRLVPLALATVAAANFRH